MLRRSKVVNDVQIVEDGAEALDFLFCRGLYKNRMFSHPPSLVMLDLKLPKIGGLDVLKAIRADERTKAIPVVIFTSSKEQKDLIRGYHLGTNGFVQKPVDFGQFGEAVRLIGMFWMLINQPPPPEAFVESKALAASNSKAAPAP